MLYIVDKILYIFFIVSFIIYITYILRLLLTKKEIIDYNNNNTIKIDEISKKLRILLTHEEFEKIETIKDMDLYYFPNECPNYTEKIYLKTFLSGHIKYFIPEKNTLISINKNHEWFTDPKELIYWKKSF